MYIQLLLILITNNFFLTFDTFLFCLVWLLKQLGANGYIFAIDANGYLLLHPNLQPKVMRVVATIYKSFRCCSCLTPPALMLSYSLWTSPSPWHWIFWMQRWRTAVKRRWAWNAPGPRCSRFQALCALVTELVLDVTTGPVGSRSSRGTFSPCPCDFSKNLLTEKIKNALCILDPATNDWWTTGWNADQNSPQVHRWGKFLKWFHLNETLKSTFVDPELYSWSQKQLYLNWIMY